MKSIILIFSFMWLLYPGIRTEYNPGDNEYEAGFVPVCSLQDTTLYIYVGAEACAAKCHNNEELGYQYNSWRNSRHSMSWASLSGEKALVYSKNAGISGAPFENQVCLNCHVTAAGLGSSSLGAAYKMADGVTCEACHKGEFLPKTFLPGEEECLKCHNNSVHAVSPFDFKERCLKISHPVKHKKSMTGSDSSFLNI